MRKPPPIGQTFGRLTVVGEVHVAGTRRGGRDNRYDWLVRCDCGNERAVQKHAATSGHTISCGCYGKNHLGDWKRRHGKYLSPVYFAWAAMIQRCHNPNMVHYPRWGGRGIRVCDEWRSSFDAFYAYLGDPPSPKHSLDRYPNNDGNYEPGNVRWATASEQMFNTRRSLAYKANDFLTKVRTMPDRIELQTARLGAMALRKRRPDLNYICADLVKNIEFQMQDPEDQDFKDAGMRLFREIERRTAAHHQ